MDETLFPLLYFSQVFHRNPRYYNLHPEGLPAQSTVLTVITMMRKRLKLRVGTTASAPTDVTVFGEVTGSRITVRVAEEEMKDMQPSARGVCPWASVKARHYGEGKCQLFSDGKKWWTFKAIKKQVTKDFLSSEADAEHNLKKPQISRINVIYSMKNIFPVFCCP